MANNATLVPSKILLSSIVFKLIALIIGVLGNITVIIYAIFVNKERTATSYLVGNLALADLLMCLTLYPMWIIEFILTILNIESDQDLFCKLSRPAIWSLLFSSVATLLAITVDRYLYIVKPLKYPLIVTKRRVFQAISGIWTTACWLFIVHHIHYKRFDFRLRSLCNIPDYVVHPMYIWFCYIPLTLIFILNVRILIIARKHRKRILAETNVHYVNNSTEPLGNSTAGIRRFFRAIKSSKTFCIVVIVLTICCFTPTVVGTILSNGTVCNLSCQQIWYLVFQYEFYGINSIVNAFIYGMRHIKHRKAYVKILFKILRCNKATN